MAHIAGVKTQKNTKGEITYVTINVKKHKELITPVLQELGVLQKSKFMQEYEQGITIDESKKRVFAKIDDLWSK